MADGGGHLPVPKGNKGTVKRSEENARKCENGPEYKSICSLYDEKQRHRRKWVPLSISAKSEQRYVLGFHGYLCDGNSQAIPARGASGHMLLVNECVRLAYGLGWGQLAMGVGGGSLPP